MFELILQFAQPVAAIIPEHIATVQLAIIYRLLPPSAIIQRHLSDRWNKAMVLSTDDWASEQLRRVPCFPPSGVKLQFIQ